MDLENIKINRIIHKEFKKCGFCGKNLKPIGFDYLYFNISQEFIEYERCNCKGAQEYWKQKDIENIKTENRKKYREIIKKIYKDIYLSKRLQKCGLENFIVEENEKEIDIVKNYIEKCINKDEQNGLIITGNSGTGKTHLAAAIANKLIENGQIVLFGRLSYLLDMVKDTFYDDSKSEKDLMDLYSNIDMLVIDDLGTEKISQWVLEKLFIIISNRYDNNLPIIITTKFNKDQLFNRFEQSKDKELTEFVILKIYQMCYGIHLKNNYFNKKEKASTSDQTKC